MSASLHARRLLRRHVGRSPHDGARLRQVAVALDPPGQAEVGHVRLAALVDQDVRRLQVAVEDPALMGVVHRLRDDRDQPGRGADVAAEVAEPLVEAGAGDQLHAEVMQAPALADLEDRDDVGVVELRDRLGLVLEPETLGSRWRTRPT